MPEAQLSKASAVSYHEIQLDICNKLSGHLGRNFKPKRGGMAQSVEHIVHIPDGCAPEYVVRKTNKGKRGRPRKNKLVVKEEN